MSKSLQTAARQIFIVLFSYILISFIFFKELNAQPDAAVINFDSVHQIIRGFGAANIRPWRGDMTTAEINTAFATGDGQLGFSILRLRVPNSQSEFSLNVPTARSAHSLGVTLIASPWSPPASMKTNTNIVGGELLESYYDEYAAHLKSFADYMADNDAPIYAVSVQNEPDVNVNYESCDWNASQMLKFVKENARAIGTKVIAPESFQFRRVLSDPLLNDSAANANFDILGGHIYGGGLSPYPLAENKGKEIWMTEYLINSGSSSGTNPTGVDTGWIGAMQTAKSIHDCMVVNMSAYIWWYIVRFYGPINDGSFNLAKGSPTKKGYVISHFARFVRPEFYRIEATENPQSGIYVTAYKKGERIVIIAVNENSSPVTQTFNIQNGPSGIYTPYVTSEVKNCARENDIEAVNGSFAIDLDASSITTFVSDGDPNIPVELTSFSAEASINKVTLSWETATELNNYGFEVQRSYDKKNFASVGFVKGSGTADGIKSYRYIDNKITGRLYYRLKQVDFNGTFKYSDIVEVSTTPPEFELSQNYPNPFNPVTNIEFRIPASPAGGTDFLFVSLKVYDIIGNEVATLVNEEKPAGTYKIKFNTEGLACGAYFYQLKAGSFTDTKKLILLK